MKLNTVVRFAPWYREWCLEAGLMPAMEGFCSNETFVYLGEIANMPGHGIYAGRDGRVYWGYHLEDFEEVPEDDL